jgi:hypothetical protein
VRTAALRSPRRASSESRPRARSLMGLPWA